MPRMCKSGNTLCWDCKREDCDWIRFGKPVLGWRANPTKIYYNEGEVDSFIVEECPSYIPPENVERIKCKRCGKLLFIRETRRHQDSIMIKCPRCKKLQRI